MPPPASCQAQLLVWRGAALVEALPLASRPFWVAGRLAVCDLTLEHASASRRHAAVLHHRSGAFYVLDLGSAHGTFLDGKRLPAHEPALWRDGVPCVFGASSRTHVLHAGSGQPLVPPRPSRADDGRPSAKAAPAPRTNAPVLPAAPATVSATSPAAPRESCASAAAAISAGDDDGGGGGGGDDDDDEWLDEECEANTLRNTHIPAIPPPAAPPLAPAGGPAPARKRKRLVAVSVHFDERPPQVRFFDAPSPEPICDPEAPRSAAACGSAPKPLPRPKTSVTTVSVGTLATGTAPAVSGQFGHLVDEVSQQQAHDASQLPPPQPSATASASAASDSATSASAAEAASLYASLYSERLSAMYSASASDAEQPAASLSASYPKERWQPRASPKVARRPPAAGGAAARGVAAGDACVRVESHAVGDGAAPFDELVVSAGWLTLQRRGLES